MHSLRYTRLSPLFDETSLVADSNAGEEAASQAFGHKAFLLLTWVHRSLHGLG